MKLNKNILSFLTVIVFLGGMFFFTHPLKTKASEGSSTAEIKRDDVSSTITASGDVEAENQASLSFLTGGRVAFLGVKTGDHVQKGEMLANLDTTIASHNLTAAKAQYRSAQAGLNLVLDNIHLFQYGNGGFGNVGTSNETQTQQTARQQAQEAVNMAYDDLQIAQDQLSLQSIIAPFDGTVLSVQNIDEGMNVTPTSGSMITLVGGENLKFVADIAEQDIDKISIGQQVNIILDSNKNRVYGGNISNIAQAKTTLPDGRVVFKVDIQSEGLLLNAQAGQTGTIQISTSQFGQIVVPSWTILEDKFVWVMENNKPVLKKVTVGETSDGKTSITSGLGVNDKVILDPEIIVKGKYKIL